MFSWIKTQPTVMKVFCQCNLGDMFFDFTAYTNTKKNYSQLFAIWGVHQWTLISNGRVTYTCPYTTWTKLETSYVLKAKTENKRYRGRHSLNTVHYENKDNQNWLCRITEGSKVLPQRQSHPYSIWWPVKQQIVNKKRVFELWRGM